MQTKLSLFVAVMAVFLMLACKKESEPEFSTVLEQNFSGVNKKTAKYSAYIVFNNISDQSYKVENLVADLLVNGKDACTLYFNDPLEVKPHAEFKIPVRQSFDPGGIFKADSDGFSGTVRSELKGTLKLNNDASESIEIEFNYAESVKVVVKKEERQQSAEEKKLSRKEKREAKKAGK